MTDDVAADVRQRLEAEAVRVIDWADGPDDRYAPHAHDYDKALVVIEGSITFRLVGPGTSFELRAGDRLDLPARTIHAAEVGADGVRCLEGHLRAGSLGPDPRSVADWAAAARMGPGTDDAGAT